MPSLSDLLKPPTAAEIKEGFVAFFKMIGFPVASWGAFSEPRATVEHETTVLEDLGELIKNIAKGGFLSTAGEVADEWVDLNLEEVYDDKRKAAVHTEGVVKLTDAGNTGPHTITAGALWVSTDDGLRRYVSTSGGTLTLGGTLEITVKAETAGAAWNVAADTITTLVTSLAGVTVTNPADEETGIWNTVQGTDSETNAEAVARAKAKWATLGTGSNKPAYEYWTLNAHAEVTRVRVTSIDGAVTVLFAGTSGPVSSAAATAVQTAITEKKPIAVPCTVTNATARVVSVQATIYVKSGQDLVAAKAAAQAAVEAYARTTEIAAVAYAEAIDEALMSPEHVYNVVRTSPAIDVVLATNEVFVPSFNLTAVYA